MAIFIVVSPALWIPFVQRRHYGGLDQGVYDQWLTDGSVRFNKNQLISLSGLHRCFGRVSIRGRPGPRRALMKQTKRALAFSGVSRTWRELGLEPLPRKRSP